MKKNNKIKGQEGHAPSEDSRAGSFFSSPGAPGVLWLTAASLCKPGPLSVCRWLPLASYACQCRRQNRLGFDPQVGKICWRRKWQPTPVYLPGESHGQRSWRSTVHRVAKSQTQLKRLSTHRCNIRPLLMFTCLEISILYSATFLNSLFSILFLFSFPLWVFFLNLLFKHLYLEIPRIPKAQNKTKLSES